MPDLRAQGPPRLVALEGLRGTAAISILIFHLSQTWSKAPVHTLMNHGYLAVEFFYLLSGFVSGYAYRDNAKQMSDRSFLLRRVARLHPLVLAGSLIGGVLFYLGASPQFPAIAEARPWQVFLSVILHMFMIPVPERWDIRGSREMFPLNYPAWCIMSTYIGSIFFSSILRRLSMTALSLCAVISALFTLHLALGLDVFGLMGDRAQLAHTVEGGWILNTAHIYIGIVRYLFPFLCGLWLGRRHVRHTSGGSNTPALVDEDFWMCVAILGILLGMPRLGGETAPWKNQIYEAIAVLTAIPLLVSMASNIDIRNPRTVKICKWLGNLSYPLSATHYPLIYIHMAFAVQHPTLPKPMQVISCVLVGLMAIAVAHLLMVFYDTPVRKWLATTMSAKKRS
eukprot:Protomagalhaensia_sp_Gyna_25__1868@NODE_1990_length_1363_cov_10_160121_g1640_i0_p1_GENE_NODE_1990_length_1363_cov_10_160121_g1640_i0NODE_1990_length_1363_cov_10_160121_g1640_i0_p1_ORF_typecomplete_len396_score16_14Acyl_transf_3/PF01757_22/1_9e27DUF1624/PF07786_12/4_5e06DUF1624/PF07786_12/1_5e03DUF1624/PF07786_12/1_1e03OpgC_C/PF10129_9/4_3e05DUF3693/PF12472_8/0_36TssN/PF17555_2/0_054TssN/PF17555_2/1_1e03TssN/PF17555_2/8_1e02_NODE_1990_length_1363_cov_10_160121_g1640_i0641251